MDWSCSLRLLLEFLYDWAILSSISIQVLGQVSPDPKSVYQDVALNEAGKNRSMDYLPCEKEGLIMMNCSISVHS